MCEGAYGHIMSCQVLNGATSRGPDSYDAYPVLKAPGRGYWEPGRVLSRGGG
jgi:hypothetical protein